MSKFLIKISFFVACKLKGKEDDIMLFGDRDGKMSYLDLQTLTVSIRIILRYYNFFPDFLIF